MLIDADAKVTFVCGDEGVLKTQYCDIPFSDNVIDFCSEISRQLLSNKETKEYGDLTTFAFYCRRANLNVIRNQFSDSSKRLGWGLVLHIAPANIPINFAYSFLFGLLSGNGNIVRLPSRRYPQIDLFCRTVASVFDQPEYQQLNNANAFIRFDRESIFLKKYIQCFDALMVWGGDETVKNIRKLPRAPRSIEVSFSNRYSFALLSAKELLRLDKQGLEVLCNDFYNDTYLVDQNACSSPNLICWDGDKEDIKKAKALFWHTFRAYLESRYDLNAVHAIDKKLKLLKYLDDYPLDLKITEYGAAITVATLHQISSFNHHLTGVFGLFFELELGSIEDVLGVVNSKYQTLCYFGVCPKEIRSMVFEKRCKGIDRIVPIGSALDIGTVWDGFDLIKTLSRVITIK